MASTAKRARIDLDLPEEDVQSIEESARGLGVSRSEFLRRATVLLQAATKAVNNGASLEIVEANGTRRHVRFK